MDEEQAYLSNGNARLGGPIEDGTKVDCIEAQQ
jgi:hypothetical protein